MSVVPDQVTANWCSFAQQCVKRGHVCDSEQLDQLLGLEIDVEAFSKLVCSIAFYSKDTLLPVLDKVMDLVIKQWSEKQD